MNSPFNFPIGKHAPAFISRFDSATDMVGALSSFLKGETFEGVGATPTNEVYAKFINNIPSSWKQKLYTKGGISDAASHKEIDQIDAEELDKWIYNVYPEKKYPAIAIGSSNGAMVHLCAALGIPWLPQTMLIPVYKGETLPIDQPKKTIEWAQKPAEAFLNNNADWQLHHMMDPSQDRLRVGPIAYFRVKKLRLGKWYQKFIRERLEAGGKIIVIDCQQQWPTVRLGERYFFQFGGMGGIEPLEYYQGGERIKSFLKEQNAEVEQWDAPEPDGESPEAEWGFEPTLLKDLKPFAKAEGIRLHKISFEHPQAVSPFVADLHRWWYRQLNRPSDRLLVESFTVQAPLLTLQTASIPYWLFFNVEPAADMLENYLQNSSEFDEIFMMILSHGKNSLDHTTIDRWRSIMEKARQKHDFIGMEPEKYPLDLAIYARYSPDLQKKIQDRFPLPSSLSLQQLKDFLSLNPQRFAIETDFEAKEESRKTS